MNTTLTLSDHLIVKLFRKLCVSAGRGTDLCHTQQLEMNGHSAYYHFYGNDSSGSPWGDVSGSLAPQALSSLPPQKWRLVEPVHGDGLWRLTSISSVTLSVDTLRNIGHLVPWPLHTGSGLLSVKLHCKKE